MATKYLKSRNQELEIPEKNPFANDKLDRLHIASVLTDIVSFYGQSGCVMALDGEWGAGKTTFVKMWAQHLKNTGFKTLYFNAWTTDYSDDALMVIVSELKELSPQDDNTCNKIATGAARILLSVGKGMFKKMTGVNSEEIDAILSESSDIGKEYLKEYATKKTTIEEFKHEVTEYVAYNAAEHPIVFFIDELDRCNPHYAVSVLERVKHLFDIPNIIFVLAINKIQLCNAIQGYFGSTNIDSNEYLRRFIDIEYTLPAPKLEAYCEYLYNEYGFDDFFQDSQRLQYFRSSSEADLFKKLARMMFELFHSNLRQIERIYAYARLALMQFYPNTYLVPDVYFLLCFWKITNPPFYLSIRNKEYTPQELLTELEKILPHSCFNQAESIYMDRYLLYTIAGFIYCYDITDVVNQRPSQPSISATEVNGKLIYPLKSEYLNKDGFNEALNYYYTQYSESRSNGLSYIFNRIDLLESFK